MSLTIKEQFDYCYPERFDPLFGQNRLVISGLFLEGVGDLVLKDLDVASRVLRTIELGRVDIFCQERIFQWIHELHHLALANRLTSFTESFYSAMSALTDKTDARFKRRGYHSTLNKDEASEHYGFGGIAAYISYGPARSKVVS